MVNLQTLVPAPADLFPISHSNSLLLLGSCFTENMGQRLVQSGFEVLINPFGIQYNPLSIAQTLQKIILNEDIVDDDLVQHNGLWHSWLHHGSFSDSEKHLCLQKCNQSLHQAHDFLLQADTLMVTFGTAFVYENKASGKIVANCHKIPATQFQKRLLTIEEILHAWKPLLSHWNGRILFTVSPIRHWADGAHGNQVSKSTLLLALHQLQAPYFPAYEILMDELRDYRFYADDLLHPSPLAEEIVWQRFRQSTMDARTQTLAEKYLQLHKMKAHSPLFPSSEGYQIHLQKIAQLEKELEQQEKNL